MQDRSTVLPGAAGMPARVHHHRLRGLHAQVQSALPGAGLAAPGPRCAWHLQPEPLQYIWCLIDMHMVPMNIHCRSLPAN